MSIEHISNFLIPEEFACTIINDKLILSNVYVLQLGIDPIEDAHGDIGIGIQKIKHLIGNYLQNSIFINQNNNLVKHLSEMENNIVYLPCEPYDYYIGSILFSKFVAITEKYFEINYIKVASAVGDQVQYTITSPYDCGLELDGDYWWNIDSVSTGQTNTITWDELNLTHPPKFQPNVVQGGLSGNK